MLRHSQRAVEPCTDRLEGVCPVSDIITGVLLYWSVIAGSLQRRSILTRYLSPQHVQVSITGHDGQMRALYSS